MAWKEKKKENSVQWQFESMWKLLNKQRGNGTALSTGQKTAPNPCVKGGGKPLS